MVKVSRLGTGLVALTPCKPSGYSSMLVPNDCLDVAGKLTYARPNSKKRSYTKVELG